MEESPKYEWFLSFKSNLKAEKYITAVSDRWQRSALARFRVRTLGLYGDKVWF